MAEKLVTGEPGSRWVPHPAFRHRLYPKCTPPPALLPQRAPRPPPAASCSRLHFEAGSPPGPPAPPAAPGSGKRGRRRAGPGAGRSPRGRFPPPPQPPPPLTPGTRPGPRGRHRVTQPGRRRGEGRPRAGGDGAPAVPGARRPRVGIPSPPAPPRRAPSTPSPLRSSVGQSR